MVNVFYVPIESRPFDETVCGFRSMSVPTRVCESVSNTLTRA